MKKILENVKASFALIVLRICDILMLLGSVVGVPFIIIICAILSKYEAKSWFMDMLKTIYTDDEYLLNTISDMTDETRCDDVLEIDE